MSGDGAAARRLAAQGLAGPPPADPVAVCHRLLAVQAQDLRGARLAIRARTRGLTAADVDRAMTEERALVVSWFNRGTLHLVGREDFWWLHALTAPPQIRRTATRLGQEGVSPDMAERAVGVIGRALAEEGPLTRDVLRERLRGAGVPVAGQALPHLLGLACLRAVAVRGPVVAGRQAFALVRDWLGAAEPVDRDRALAELARRYLRGHGPACDRDLARWVGLPLRDARAGLAAIGAELVEREDGLVDLDARASADAPPPAPPRLLGPFDPLLLGWCSREPVVGRHTHLVTVNGLFRPFALVGGRAAATWRLVAGRVALEPFAPLAPAAARALDADASDVQRFLAA